MILSNRQLRVLLFPHVRSFVISQLRQPHVNGGVLVFLFVSRIVSRFQLCNCMFISASFMGVLFLNKSGNLSKICLFSDWWSSCNRMFPFVSLNFSIPIHRFLRQPLCFHSRLRSVFLRLSVQSGPSFRFCCTSDRVADIYALGSSLVRNRIYRVCCY